MKYQLCKALSILGLSLAIAGPASADLIFTLDQSSSLSGGPFGTVTLHQDGLDNVLVTVDLAPGVGFANTGLVPFTFNLDAALPTLTAANFSGLTAGFSLDGTSPVHNDGAGTFTYGLLCTTLVCGTGGNAPFVGPLSFELTLAGLLETSFIANGGTNGDPNPAAFFAADICSSIIPAGQDNAGHCTPGSFTGVTYTTAGSTSGGGGGSSGGTVPEPGTLALLGLGFLLIAFGRRGHGKRL
jgi:hypothetical protein